MLTHVFEVASDFLETRSWLEDKFAVPFGEPGAGAVQWSLNDDKEFEYSLNDNRLTPSAYDYGCGAFELYPTTNHYQFILLNKANGKQWHVQWGFEKKGKIGPSYLLVYVYVDLVIRIYVALLTS